MKRFHPSLLLAALACLCGAVFYKNIGQLFSQTPWLQQRSFQVTNCRGGNSMLYTMALAKGEWHDTGLFTGGPETENFILFFEGAVELPKNDNGVDRIAEFLSTNLQPNCSGIPGFAFIGGKEFFYPFLVRIGSREFKIVPDGLRIPVLELHLASKATKKPNELYLQEPQKIFVKLDDSVNFPFGGIHYLVRNPNWKG